MKNDWEEKHLEVLRDIVDEGRPLFWPPVGPRLAASGTPSSSRIRNQLRKQGWYAEWKKNRKNSKW